MKVAIYAAISCMVTSKHYHIYILIFRISVFTYIRTIRGFDIGLSPGRE